MPPEVFNMTKVANIVRQFKREYYLKELVKRNFNVSKTCRQIGACRNDLYNHLPKDKEAQIELAEKLKLLPTC